MNRCAQKTLHNTEPSATATGCNGTCGSHESPPGGPPARGVGGA